MHFLLRWILMSAALWAMPKLISGVRVDGLSSALAASFILGVLNTVVRPILLILTFPLTIFSFGLFILVLNGFLLFLVGRIVKGFEVASFGTAFIAALILSLISWIFEFSYERDGARTRVIFRKVSSKKSRDLN